MCIPTLDGKRLELLAPNLVHIYSMAGPRHALIQRSEGHTVTKSVTVAWLLVKCAAAVGVGLHVV